ncbi:hypothetical protein E2986_12688 [Frieseomelitta varia]|uniref:Uncharacterized protein n=1 Tax=Frieseomelitta varia TaxID=561572 RepID=A0A833VRB6_9HYME|nr:hypothetical protein E2986_12688 [Frieseomelitta varia]
MTRYLLFAFLFVCLVYVLQATPVAEEPQQSPQQTASTLDELANKAKKMFDDVKEAFEHSDLNNALEKTKAFIGQTGENIRKEIEKLTDKHE